MGTLANWRAASPRVGPRFMKIGHDVRYWLSVIEDWERGQVQP